MRLTTGVYIDNKQRSICFISFYRVVTGVICYWSSSLYAKYVTRAQNYFY